MRRESQCRRRVIGSTVGVVLVAASLAGCSVSGASPFGSPASPGASSRSASSMEANFGKTVTVPAGGSVDVPLSFEGTSAAQIFLSASDSSIGASFGSTTLTGDLSGSEGGSLGASLSNPLDGPLHITNSGSVSETVLVIVMIETGRKLTVTSSVSSVANGQTVNIDVVLTQPVTGDSVGAELVDPAGTHTPITLTQAGDGHWTGQVTPTVGGGNDINAWTNGNGIRRAQTALNVEGGNVTIGGGFTERLNDTNADGLADQLILTLPVTVAGAGTYQIQGRLADSDGNTVAVHHDPPIELSTGAQTLEMTFDGLDIYASGRSGPYRVKDVMISSNPLSTAQVLEASVSDMGQTQPYDYKTFQH